LAWADFALKWGTRVSRRYKIFDISVLVEFRIVSSDAGPNLALGSETSKGD